MPAQGPRRIHQSRRADDLEAGQALDNASKLHPELDYVEGPIAAVLGVDLVLHLTEWHHFTTIDPSGWPPVWTVTHFGSVGDAVTSRALEHRINHR
ncbi:hypothetical protein GCM10010302_42410 [Streptomyces polychromogenes]|uniref:Uncharacterized protein n=1 Tax=Streptomyces polychromogenes TaxID=67342 RepID=A0ABN0VGN4_9ACTN